MIRIALFTGLVAVAACSSDEPAVTSPDAPVTIDAGRPDANPTTVLPTLSQYGFFQGTGATQEPVLGVVPYTVNASLFSDYADKHRFIALPAGGKITYSDDDKWKFPVGTKIVKSFGYGDKLIETRVLINQETGWLPTTYRWNDDQTEATLLLTGADVPVTYTDENDMTNSTVYRVPDQNDCFNCHFQRGLTDIIGLRTRQLNRTFDYGHGEENQIEHMATLGMFDRTPAASATLPALADPYGSAPVEERARAWLEANCSHCHQDVGAAAPTHLFLFSTITNPIDFGVCRVPNAAGNAAGGRPFDVVPGHPEQSVMAYRIASTDPAVKMPEIPIKLVDQRGVTVVGQWITGLTASGSCSN